MVEHMHHPLFRITALIKYKIGDKKYNATGFFANVNGSDYIITNKHVFEHELGIDADELAFHFLPTVEASDTQLHTISLEERDWLTHPSKDADVAALPLEEFEIDQTGNLAVTEDKFVSKYTDWILSGNSAIVVGYPEAGWFSQNKTPLVRNALISSFFGTQFNGDDCFIIDAKMHDGMSGSPVLIAPSAIMHDVDGNILQFHYDELDEVPELLGIHSGPIHQDNQLDLHRIWYTDIIREIVES